MRCAIEDERCVVFDDFLSPPDFARVQRFVRAQRYLGIHSQGRDPAWPLHDGEPLAGPVVHSVLSQHALGQPPGGAVPAAHVYPTGTGIDRLIEELSLCAARLSPWIGEQGQSWSVFTARAFLYPPGTALGWHTDSQVFTGAFSYYAHPDWNSRFGGELLLANTPPGWKGGYGNGSPLDDGADDALLLELGSGLYLSPKPNRLVVIKAGTLHRINPVHSAAGIHVRSSIAGFFVRRDAPASAMLEP